MPNVDFSCVAILVPCYNEEVTIAKVVTDMRRELPGLLSTFTTTTRLTAPSTSPPPLEPSCASSLARARVTLCARCFVT